MSRSSREPCAYCGAKTRAVDTDGAPACPPHRCGAASSERVSPRARRHSYKGELLTVRELAQRGGLTREIVHGRLALGWTVERAVETPLGTHGGPRQKRAA